MARKPWIYSKGGRLSLLSVESSLGTLLESLVDQADVAGVEGSEIDMTSESSDEEFYDAPSTLIYRL